MNRRKFFGAVAAAVTAACVPGKAVSLHNVEIQYPRLFDRAGFIAARYSSRHSWWRPCYGAATFPTDMRQLEVRTLASLQTAWKECLAYKSGDTLMIDEQAYEVFKTLQE